VACASGGDGVWTTASVAASRSALRQPGAAAQSERLDDREDHDADHENCRYLIDNSIELLRVAIAVGGKIAHAAHKKAVQRGEPDDQGHLGLQPACDIEAPRPRQP